jgi:hypothetical protein
MAIEKLPELPRAYFRVVVLTGARRPRAETLAALRIGETTLHWLARTEKLNAIKIGARVQFSAAEVERLARRGCSLTEEEKRAAIRPRLVSAERGDLGKREDRPSTPAGEVDKHGPKLDTEDV